jgi:phospholipid transport system substrate-binding protein
MVRSASWTLTRVLAVWVLLLSCAAAAATPEAVVGQLHLGLTALSSELGGEFADRVERLRPLIEETHDLAYIGQFALGRNWDGLAADEREQYLAAFEELSVSTYAARFVRLAEDSLQLGAAETGPGGRMVVHASIRRQDAPAIPLDYVLHETSQGWRIINIVADGVSDLALKRAEYQRLFGSGGFDALQRELLLQIQRLGAGAGEDTPR